MTLEEANKITNLWGKYLEHTHGKLGRLFFNKIPESLLPYPKKVIEEACNIMAEHYFKLGNKEAVNTFEGSSMLLELYANDEESLIEAVKRFSNPKTRKAVLSILNSKDITEIQEKGL